VSPPRYENDQLKGTPVMPMIQIEQDSPELIARVNSQIEQMVERMRRMPGTVIVAVAEEFVRGYLTALSEQDLLSNAQWQRLTAEVMAAAQG